MGTGNLIKGRAPQAIRDLSEAERLDPENPVIQNTLGLAYLQRKEFDFAREHFQKAVNLNSEYTDARNNLGRLYIEMARYDAGIAELEVVVKDLKYDAPEKGYLNLGIAHMRKNELMKAEEYFIKSLQLNSRFCPTHNFYGQLLYRQQKYTKAIDYFENALKLCNNNYDEAHYYGALSYYKTGATSKAVARLEEVVRNYPESDYSKKAAETLRTIRQK